MKKELFIKYLDALDDYAYFSMMIGSHKRGYTFKRCVKFRLSGKRVEIRLPDILQRKDETNDELIKRCRPVFEKYINWMREYSSLHGLSVEEVSEGRLSYAEMFIPKIAT